MISVNGDNAKAGNHVRQSPCKYQHEPSNHPIYRPTQLDMNYHGLWVVTVKISVGKTMQGGR